METPVACKVLTTCDSDDIATLEQAAAALATSATLLAKLEEVGLGARAWGRGAGSGCGFRVRNVRECGPAC